MPRRRKKTRPSEDEFNFIDYDEQLDSVWAKIQEHLERILHWAASSAPPEQSERLGRNPIIYGISVSPRAKGGVNIHEFGHTKPSFGVERKMKEFAGFEREPLVEIIENEKNISLTVELPGVEKEDIDLEVDEDMLIINVDTAERKYYKEIPLPRRVLPETTEATYKNGVLDITVECTPEAEPGAFRSNIIIEPPEEVKAVEQLEAELEEKSRLAENYLQKLMRLQEDFISYKRREERERAEQREQAKKEILLNLLELADNFERALEAAKHTRGKKALMKGVEMIYKQLVDVLRGEGVRPIEAREQPFDPHLHEAVMQCPSHEYPENTVIEEVQKGYLMGDKVLRPARVKVSSRLEDVQQQDAQEPGGQEKKEK